MNYRTLTPALLALALIQLPSTAAAGELVAKPVTGSITLDGTVEKAWQAAPVLKVRLDETPYEPSNGYQGMTSTEVELQALYDDQNLYLLVQYDDPDQSLERYPWVKQANGRWKQKTNPDSTGHENTFYEDKFSFLWDINATGFEKKGCDVACHMPVNGKINGIEDTSAGRKYLRAGQTVDMWHWKSVRTNPLDQTDDQFIDSTNNPKENKNWGRKGDNSTGGGYSDNRTEDKTRPKFMAKNGNNGGYWRRKDNTVPFEDTFQPGDQVAGIVVSAFEGSRGDIATSGRWQNGRWTLEFRRALTTSGPQADVQDVQFQDMKQTYPFGIAVFDNTQINHLFHFGSHLLSFE